MASALLPGSAMPLRHIPGPAVALAVLVVACGDTNDGTAASAGAVTAKGGGGATAGAPAFGAAPAGGTSSGGNPSCVAPDMVFALDRSLTMHRTPDGDVPPDTQEGHASSKWAQAIAAIGRVVAPPRDQGISFGLELWPKADDGCISLADRIRGLDAVNPRCEGPDVVVPPGPGTGATIARAIDPEKTPICVSTPTGAALLGAATELKKTSARGKRQFVVLITDGADWDRSCPAPDPLATVDELAAAGIDTVVVGFGADTSAADGVGAGFLNDMACAGRTAKGFPRGCAQSTSTQWRAAPNARQAYYTAGSSDELFAALDTFSASVCCDCVK